MITRDAFLAATVTKLEKVEIPELGGCVYVRQLTAGERDRLEATIQKRKGRNARATIVAFVTVDDKGGRLFGPNDADAIADVPACVVEPIIEAHVRINGMSGDDLADLEKN